MNKIKSLGRVSLTDSHLEDELRICLNTPDNEDEFDPNYYAKIWIQKGHMRSDDPAQIRRQDNPGPTTTETVEIVYSSSDSFSSNIENYDDTEIISMAGSSSSSIQAPPNKIPRLGE